MVGDKLDGLASYVPLRVVRQLAAGPPPSEGPRVDRFAGAVLLADISGFTALTESLARHGDAGTEDLTRCLNLYFGRLIDVIAEHGGDIFKFAGDALLAMWDADAESLRDSACRAVQCGLAAQSRLNDFPAIGDVHLSLRIGVSAGRLAILDVGGMGGRRDLVATGEPLVAMSAAKAAANPGDVAISAKTWTLDADRIDAEPLAGGSMRALGVRQPIALRPLDPLHAAADQSALLPYVPPAVVDQLRRGGSGWLGELRRVTVLFVNFPGLTPATPLERAQSVMLELQTSLSRYEGTINKLSLDDKGASLVAAFGLPPLSHDDDAERGVRAALEIRERLALMQVRHSTGLATGPAFCGIVGNATRREYTMIGDVVNLAARLMQAAKGDVLCDAATYDAARARLGFERVGALALKGKAADTLAYHPVGPVERQGGQHAEFTGTTLGRVAEQQAIDESLRALAERRDGAFLVFQGMAGIGKSRLLEETKRRARQLGLPCLESDGYAIERSTAFYVWRSIFDQAFGLDADAGADERQALVAARIAERGRPEWVELLPLLNPVLRTSFAPTDATASMTEQARAPATYELLADLLVALPPDGSRHVVLLEGAQWMDSASVALASRICARRAPLAIVAAMRPVPNTAVEEVEALVDGTPHARRFNLEPLGADDTVEIACRALGVSRVPDSVAAIVRSKADGNPLLSQELAGAIVDAGLLEIVEGECRLAPGADLRSLDLPNSIQGAVTARMDRLSHSQRLLLKIGSVIGRVFEADVAVRLLDGQADEATVRDDLRALEAARIIRLDRSDPPAFAFRHVAFQEVTYRQMLFSQRRALHQAVAELLEERQADALPTAYTRLALHWSKAVEEGDADPALISKAIEYLQKAAEQSLQQFANEEAVEFLTTALHLLERLPASVDRSRRELALCCLIGAPLLVTRGFAAPETERAYSRASQLCQEIENSPDQFNAVYGLWGFALMKTDLARARGLAAEVFRLAQGADDPELLLPAHRAMGDTAFWLGDPTTARVHLERAAALYRPEHHAREVFRTGQDQGVIASALSAWAIWLLGYPDTALTRMEETLALARRLSHGHTTAMTFQNFTMTHQFRGEVDEVLAKADAQLALSNEQGFPLWLAGATILRGWARSKRGQADEGIADMRRGVEGWRATGAELAAPYYLSLLAEACGAAGRPEAGIEVILEAQASSTRSGEAWWRAELWRIEAELRLKLGSPDEDLAERRLLEALDLARAQQARSLELRAAASLCRLRTKRGAPAAEAQQPLVDALGWFTEGTETADLREAAQLLSTASSVPKA